MLVGTSVAFRAGGQGAEGRLGSQRCRRGWWCQWACEPEPELRSVGVKCLLGAALHVQAFVAQEPTVLPEALGTVAAAQCAVLREVAVAGARPVSVPAVLGVPGVLGVPVPWMQVRAAMR